MGKLPQALEIIFEAQRKTSNKKIPRRKISLSTYKMHFVFFSLDPSCFQTSLYFLISYSFFNDLKCYRRATWNFTNNLWTLLATKQHTRNFLGVWEPALVVLCGLFFWVLDPFTLWGHNFLISNPFSTIVSVSDVSKFCLDTRTNEALPSTPACLPRALKCSVTSQSTLQTHLYKLFEISHIFFLANSRTGDKKTRKEENKISTIAKHFLKIAKLWNQQNWGK